MGPMEPYKGNRYPFCYALFSKADETEALALLTALERRGVRSALPARRRSVMERSCVVLLLLSPAAIRDQVVLQGVSEASAAGKTILTVYLRETELTPGLSLQLGQTQALFKYRAESEAAFYGKLFAAPALQNMSITPQQRKALRRRTLLWALAGAFVLALGLFIGFNWRPIQARFPHSTLRKLGVPLDFGSVETLYVYGDETLDRYEMPFYRLYADGEHDWVRLGDRLIPQGTVRTLDDFSLLVNLKELCVCNEPISSLDPLLSLTGLTLLDLSHDQIESFAGIGALSQLEYLNVSHVSPLSLEEITALRELRTLNIAYTDLASLEPLLSLPRLEKVYIDASLLSAAAALGSTPFEIVCLDTPVYQYGDLLSALEDPTVTDVRIMNDIIIPPTAELTIRPEVALMGAGLEGDFTVSNYGTIHVRGVWEMGLCSRVNYGTIIVEDGGLYTGGMCSTITTGVFRIETGGRQNLERGAAFSLTAGLYENDGDVYLQGGYELRFLGGRAVNNGALHLHSLDELDLHIQIDRDRFENNGTVYYKDVLIPNEKLFGEDEA